MPAKVEKPVEKKPEETKTQVEVKASVAKEEIKEEIKVPEPVVEEVVIPEPVHGLVTVKYNHYKEKFPIIDGVLQESEIDDKYCFSAVF